MENNMNSYSSIRSNIIYIIGIILIITAFFGGRYTKDATIIVPETSHPTPQHTVIQVPYEILTTKTITKIAKEYVPVEDMAAVQRLAAQNAELEVKVTQLNRVIADLKTTGEGTVYHDPIEPANVTFDDSRLSFVGNGDSGRYTLTQHFVITNTIGKNKRGVPTNLFTIDEVFQNTRTPIKNDQITVQTIAASANNPHWFMSPRIQAGIGVRTVKNATTTTPHIIIAAQWLKRGKTTAPEDITIAVVSPSMTIAGTAKSYGVLPLSVNLGSLPKQPFTNIWVSPYVGTTDFSAVNTIGLFASVTF